MTTLPKTGRISQSRFTRKTRKSQEENMQSTISLLCILVAVQGERQHNPFEKDPPAETTNTPRTTTTAWRTTSPRTEPNGPVSSTTSPSQPALVTAKPLLMAPTTAPRPGSTAKPLLMALTTAPRPGSTTTNTTTTTAAGITTPTTASTTTTTSATTAVPATTITPLFSQPIIPQTKELKIPYALPLFILGLAVIFFLMAIIGLGIKLAKIEFRLKQAQRHYIVQSELANIQNRLKIVENRVMESLPNPVASE